MSAIPYTVERRPDTGVNNVQLGMWLFIASEVMLFGGLFSAYFMLRAAAPAPWVPLRGHLGTAALATAHLLLATGFVATANGWRRYRSSLAIGIVAALAFCAFKVVDYRELLNAGRGPAVDTQMAVYFLLTGVHLAHVAGGVLASVWVILRSGAAPHAAALANRLRALALYWAFVDVIWAIIFVLLYVA